MQRTHGDREDRETNQLIDAIIDLQVENEESSAPAEDEVFNLDYDEKEGESEAHATESEGSPSTATETDEAVSDSRALYGEENIFPHFQISKPIHWSVPWSDLMMTMFIMFAVMYIYQSSRREFLSKEGIGRDFNLGPKSTAALSNEVLRVDDPRDIPTLYDLSKKTLQARHLKNFASVDLIEDKAVRIILAGDLLFDSGQAELKTEAKRKLSDIAPIIRGKPYLVNVVGHTDDVPIHTAPFPSNWELSVVRACTVARFFIEEMEVPPEKFYLSGHSHFQPVAQNTSEENRAANRRVEIIITKERPYGTPVTIGNTIAPSYSQAELQQTS